MWPARQRLPCTFDTQCLYGGMVFELEMIAGGAACEHSLSRPCRLWSRRMRRAAAQGCSVGMHRDELFLSGCCVGAKWAMSCGPQGKNYFSNDARVNMASCFCHAKPAVTGMQTGLTAATPQRPHQAGIGEVRSRAGQVTKAHHYELHGFFGFLQIGGDLGVLGLPFVSAELLLESLGGLSSSNEVVTKVRLVLC